MLARGLPPFQADEWVLYQDEWVRASPTLPTNKIEERAKGVVDHGAERTDVGVSLNEKEMQQAYEIRAALEEVGGRAAATNTT